MTEIELNEKLSTICPVFPIFLPQDNKKYPAIVYSIIASEAIETICGTCEEDKRVQIDCFAITYKELQTLREQVLEVMAMEKKVNDFDSFVEGTSLFRRTLEFYI